MKIVLLLAKLAWRGDLRLWQVFWIGKLLLSCALYLLVSGLSALFDSNLPIMLYSLIFPFYFIFISVAIWRCAPNTNNKIWMYLVRAQIILLLVAVIVLVGFVVLDAQL